MPAADDPPSSPVTGFASTEDALAYYKSQYEQLEAELADFQASSRELEAELEKDVEAAEKREKKLREKVESLGYEVEEWKVWKPPWTVLSWDTLNSSCACALADFTYRPNTSNPKQKQMPFRTHCRRRLRRYGIRTGRSNSGSGI